MRVGKELFFAPKIRFSDLDFSGEKLPEQFYQRILGYYIQPALDSAKKGYAFASGLLIVSCIDALARIQTGGKVRKRFKNWVKENINSFNNYKTREIFFENFRNGLVHEARIKNGGEFSLEIKKTVENKGQILLVNPKLLAKEVLDALKNYISLLKENDNIRKEFLEKIKTDFEYEINN